jgi:hypothetical protein
MLLDLAFIGIIVYFLWHTDAVPVIRIAILISALTTVSTKFLWIDARIAATVAQAMITVGLTFWLICERRWSNRRGS